MANSCSAVFGAREARELAMSERLLVTKEAARRLGLSPQTLARWRVQGKGPTFLKIGRSVRYEPHAIDAFIAGRARTSTSDTGPTTWTR